MHPAGFPAGFAPTVNNLQRLVAAGGKDITSSSPLLVNLLQSDVAAATHFNNLAHQHRLPFPFDAAGPPPKRKRRPRKNKDQAAKVPKLTEGGEDASVPLPGTFPPAGSGSQQQPLENRVPPIGVEAAYNVPNSLGPAVNSTSGPGPSGTPTSGAQVHTPPLADSALASQAGPLSNQVSPNSSGTLSVSTPSPIRTTPERAIAASGGGQQMINPYTGQLEPIDGSPASERGPSKPDTQGDNTTLDVPAQLEPPPNPLVALENRLAASSQNLSLPSQLPSSPRTIDSLANRTLPNSVQVASSGTPVSTPISRHPLSNTNMPPISDSMQSRMTLPVTVVDSPHVKPPGEAANVRHPGNVPHPRPHGETPMSMPRGLHPHHHRLEGPSHRVSTPGAMGPSPMTSSPMSVMGQQQQGVDMHGIHRHPHIPQLNHPSSMELRPGVSSAPGIMSQGMRQQGPGMRLGHPDPRMKMPPPHSQAGMPPHMAADIHHGLPPYPGSIPRSRAPGLQPGGPNPPMHFEPHMMNSSRAPLPGHPPHSKMPRLQQPTPPGYYQHMQQQRMPVTSTVSSAHMMTSNAPPMHMQGHNPKSSVIADQLMRPTLNAPNSSAPPSLPHQAPPTASHPNHSGPPPPPTVSNVSAGPAAAASSAQMSHPAIASQLSGAPPSSSALQPKTEPSTQTSGSVVLQPSVESAQHVTPKVEEPSVTDSQAAGVTPKVAESQPTLSTESKSEVKNDSSGPPEPKVEEKVEPSDVRADTSVTPPLANPSVAEPKLEAPKQEEKKLEVPQESPVVEASQASIQDSGVNTESLSESTAAAKEKPSPSSQTSGESNVVAEKPQDSKLLEGQAKSDDSLQSSSNSDIVPASSQLNESVKSDIPQQQSDVAGASSEVNQLDTNVTKGIGVDSEQNSVESAKSLPSKVDIPC